MSSRVAVKGSNTVYRSKGYRRPHRRRFTAIINWECPSVYRNRVSRVVVWQQVYADNLSCCRGTGRQGDGIRIQIVFCEQELILCSSQHPWIKMRTFDRRAIGAAHSTRSIGPYSANT